MWPCSTAAHKAVSTGYIDAKWCKNAYGDWRWGMSSETVASLDWEISDVFDSQLLSISFNRTVEEVVFREFFPPCLLTSF